MYLLNEMIKCRVGIVFCGRQSSGGHNVVWGLYNAIKVHNPDSILLGFLGKFFVLSQQTFHVNILLVCTMDFLNHYFFYLSLFYEVSYQISQTLRPLKEW